MTRILPTALAAGALLIALVGCTAQPEPEPVAETTTVEGACAAIQPVFNEFAGTLGFYGDTQEMVDRKTEYGDALAEIEVDNPEVALALGEYVVAYDAVMEILTGGEITTEAVRDRTVDPANAEAMNGDVPKFLVLDGLCFLTKGWLYPDDEAG